MDTNDRPQDDDLLAEARRIVENAMPGPQVRARLGFYTKGELAEGLGISGRTLDNWISAGVAPPHARLNSLVWFREDDVRRWMAALAGQGSDAAPAGMSQRLRDAAASLPRNRRTARAAA